MIEIYREIADGLDGVDGYSHLFVLIYFACSRPKQIGALIVKPRYREGNRIFVRGVDFFDGRRLSLSKAIGRSIESTTTPCSNGFLAWPMSRVIFN